MQHGLMVSVAVGALAAASIVGGTQSASAAGLDRSGQSVLPVFDESGTGRLTFGVINPSITGSDDAGNDYDVGESYRQLSASYTREVAPGFGLTVILDQPYGSDISYNNDPSSSALGGTGADLSSEALSIIGKYQATPRFSVFGGLKIERVRADVQLNGVAYGTAFAPSAVARNFNAGLPPGIPTLSTDTLRAALGGDVDAEASIDGTYGPGTTAFLRDVGVPGARTAFLDAGGYDFEMEDSTQIGYVVGAAYEIPDIALRLVGTYHFETEHTADTTETVFGNTIDGDIDYVTPQSFNLEFQTGIAADTLLLASYRWTEFSAVEVIPDFLQSDLVNLDDGERYTLGVGRRFTEEFSGSATILFEPEGDDLVSPLGPTNGLFGLSLGLQYEGENMTFAGGVNYSMLGDAGAEVGGDSVVDFENSNSLGFGLRMDYRF